MSAYVTITEIQAARPSLSASYLYKLASIHGWKRMRVGRTVRYRWDDVCATLDKEPDTPT